MKKWKVTFSVTGAGRFPIDMLRREECFPATERDAGLIEMLNRPEGTGLGGSGILTVALETYVESKAWYPNEGRWASFGWKLNPTWQADKLL